MLETIALKNVANNGTKSLEVSNVLSAEFWSSVVEDGCQIVLVLSSLSVVSVSSVGIVQ